MRNALKIALMNISEIDVFILVLIVVNIVLAVIIRHLYASMIQVGEASEQKKHAKTVFGLNKGKEGAELKKNILGFYRFFCWAVEAMPLLGTLGTVIALINNSVDTSQLQTSFLFALTSTLWGLIGAILCKGIDKWYLEPVIDKLEQLEEQQNEKKQE